MPSPSTTGRPVIAPTTMGSVPLMPPASAAISASALRPFSRSIERRHFTMESALGIFSTITVGAPMLATETTKSSSSRSIGSMIVMSAPSSSFCLRISPPT